MNYLAHLLLADKTSNSFLGSLMGDFVKGAVDKTLPEGLRTAIVQHRRIDSFTDAHPVVKRSKNRINPEFRRYAGILIDVFYDHFLATQWTKFSDEPLTAFTTQVYAHLNQQSHLAPQQMQRTLSYMTHYDLLGSYREIDGIHRALCGIEGRLKRPSQLGRAIIELQQNHNELLVDFMDFFPELVQFVIADSATLKESAAG
ncbi:ACP phosphodiesterase [Luminiphilus sp.]|nr:ACP phosphodiesterase [Luminiphilus sp.]